MIDYTLILSTKYPDKEWSLNNNSYNELTWLSDTPKPTQDELDALWEDTLQAAQTAQAVKLAARSSALAKLKKLGLTDDEISALKGTL